MGGSTPTDRSGEVWALAARQHGVVGHGQLVARGFGPKAIHHRLRIGRLHPVMGGIYAVGRPQLSREGRWLAATLACGPQSALSHDSAAALWGIRPQRGSRPTHVSAPRSVDRDRPGVRFHRVDLPPEHVVRRDEIPVVNPARTLLNRAATTCRRQLEADVNAADIHGLITPGQLRRALDDFRGLTGVRALRALLDEHTFTLTHSELERLFLPVAHAAGLPRPETQVWVNGFRVDFFWPALGLVVETDGLRYHRTPSQQARDLVREQTHRAAGLEALRFTHWQVAHDAGWVMGTLRDVVAKVRRT